MLSSQYLAPALRVFHGEDSLGALKREVERSGSRRAVVVCGRTIGRSDALVALRALLGSLLAGVTASAREHSPVSGVEEAARFLDEARADAVIAVGGGSAAVSPRVARLLPPAAFAISVDRADVPAGGRATRVVLVLRRVWSLTADLCCRGVHTSVCLLN